MSGAAGKRALNANTDQGADPSGTSGTPTKTAPTQPGAADDTSVAADAENAAAAAELRNKKKAKKYPCGKCNEEVTTASLRCDTCEQWFHKGCIEGMTPQWFDTCSKNYDLHQDSGFLCKTCRKVWNEMRKSIKDLKKMVMSMGERIATLEKEKITLEKKVEKNEVRTEKVREGLQEVGKEVENGMEKAKEEAKIGMRTEMKDQEERSVNVVIYGIEESKEEAAEKRKEEDKRHVEAVAEKIGVEIKGEIEVKFRAGKKSDGVDARPRPMIVKVVDDETRGRLLRNASRLSRVTEMKKVFIAPDLTWEQREEARKEEKKMRDEAEKKTEEAKKEGGNEKYLVVGPRGRRRIIRVAGGAEAAH